MLREHTHVVHVGDGIRDAIYVGPEIGQAHLKASPFANPHSVEDYGARSLALMAYTEDLRFGCLHHLLAHLPALRGKPLACLCRHEGEEPTDTNACHADVLIRLLETYSDEDLLAMAMQGDRPMGVMQISA
jgi:hypothetical protein